MGLFDRARWDDATIWSLDLETSGVDARRDVILSVGMVPIRHGVLRYGERYYSLVRPPADHVPGEASMRVHHILPEEALDAPPLGAVLDEVLSRLAEGPMLVHYGKLDIGFLARACKVLGRRFEKPQVVDTLHLLSRLFQRRRMIDPQAQPYPADLTRARATFDLPAHVAHHALADALATAELFLVLRARLELETLRSLR